MQQAIISMEYVIEGMQKVIGGNIKETTENLLFLTTNEKSTLSVYLPRCYAVHAVVVVQVKIL